MLATDASSCKRARPIYFAHNLTLCATLYSCCYTTQYMLVYGCWHFVCHNEHMYVGDHYTHINTTRIYWIDLSFVGSSAPTRLMRSMRPMLWPTCRSSAELQARRCNSGQSVAHLFRTYTWKLTYPCCCWYFFAVLFEINFIYIVFAYFTFIYCLFIALSFVATVL